MPDTAPAFAFEELTPVASAPPPHVDDVRARAQAIVAAAEAQAAQIQEEARSAGYQQGLAEGKAAVMEELRPASEALAEALATARESAAMMADHVESEACRFALAVAEKIVAGAIEAQPERTLDVVRGVLRTMLERERVAIRVNPADLELVRDALGELRGSLGGMEHIDVQEERRVARGSALVRTSVGEIDACAGSKLEQLRAALASELAS